VTEAATSRGVIVAVNEPNGRRAGAVLDGKLVSVSGFHLNEFVNVE
jgi:type V secretory pathway adhesin AidA